jgi:hypothetical protein
MVTTITSTYAAMRGARRRVVDPAASNDSMQVAGTTAYACKMLEDAWHPPSIPFGYRHSRTQVRDHVIQSSGGFNDT